MSDPTHDKPSEATPEPAPIDFDHAEPATPTAEHVTCAACEKVISTEYWHYVGKILCDTCRGEVAQAVDTARRGATMGRALLRGAGVAFACGVGYAIFVGVTNIHFALVTIGIGWAVGRTIQGVTRGFGTRKHQILAVALTYFATSMGYAPAVFGALTKGASAAVSSAATSGPAAPTAAPTTSPTAAPAAPAPPPASPPPPEGGPGLAISLVLFSIVTTLFMLAAPLLDLASGFSGLLGALIIFFGLRTAWTTARGLDAPITGPHKVGSAP